MYVKGVYTYMIFHVVTHNAVHTEPDRSLSLSLSLLHCVQTHTHIFLPVERVTDREREQARERERETERESQREISFL